MSCVDCHNLWVWGYFPHCMKSSSFLYAFVILMFGLQEPRSSGTTEATEIHHLQRTLFWLHTDVGFAFVLGPLLQSQALLLSWRSGWCFHLKVSQGLHKPTSIYLKLRQQCHVWTAIIFESEATFHIAWTVLAFCMLSSSWCLVCKNQDPVAPQRLLRSITCRERCFDCIRM